MPNIGGPSLGYPTNLSTKTAAYTAVSGDLVLCNAAGGAFTITLPSNPAIGSLVTIQKIDSSVNIVTVDPTSSGTVHGDLTATLEAQWVSATFEHQGSDIWMIVAQNIPIEAFTGPQGEPGDQNVFLLENGQTVAAYEALHGVTIPVGAIIYEKDV